VDQEQRRAPLKPNPSITGAMPLPAMYEVLRANLDFIGAVNAARQLLADARSTEERRESGVARLT
jgi:hypothetical protein